MEFLSGTIHQVAIGKLLALTIEQGAYLRPSQDRFGEIARVVDQEDRVEPQRSIELDPQEGPGTHKISVFDHMSEAIEHEQSAFQCCVRKKRHRIESATGVIPKAHGQAKKAARQQLQSRKGFFGLVNPKVVVHESVVHRLSRQYDFDEIARLTSGVIAG